MYYEFDKNNGFASGNSLLSEALPYPAQQLIRVVFLLQAREGPDAAR
jgi:hypothetical protein